MVAAASPEPACSAQSEFGVTVPTAIPPTKTTLPLKRAPSGSGYVSARAVDVNLVALPHRALQK